MILQKNRDPNKQPCPDFPAVPVQTGGLFEVWANPTTNQIETFARIPLVNGRFPKSMEMMVPTTYRSTGQADRLYKSPKLPQLAKKMESDEVGNAMQMLALNSEDVALALSAFPSPSFFAKTKKSRRAAVILFGFMSLLATVLIMRRS